MDYNKPGTISEIITIIHRHGLNGQSENNILNYAVKNGLIELIITSIEIGAKVNGNEDDKPPLYFAIKQNNKEIVELLIELGADVNKLIKYKPEDKSICSEEYLIHFAASHADHEILNALAMNGADLEAIDSDGQTPLFSAISEQNTSNMSYLVSNGANIHHKNVIGQTPAEYHQYKIDENHIIQKTFIKSMLEGERTDAIKSWRSPNISKKLDTVQPFDLF